MVDYDSPKKVESYLEIMKELDKLSIKGMGYQIIIGPDGRRTIVDSDGNEKQITRRKNGTEIDTTPNLIDQL